MVKRHRKVKPKNLLFPPEFGIQKFLWKGEQHPDFFSLSDRQESDIKI
jgi:hypothetical protein